jgi:exodeoxyribonuclease VII large subunit
LAAAVLRHDPRQRLAEARERLTACRTRLDRNLERTLHAAATRLGALDGRLHSLSPLAVLDRGYALVLDSAGAVVRFTSQVAPGDKVVTRLSDGAFVSRVESASPYQPQKK